MSLLQKLLESSKKDKKTELKKAVVKTIDKTVKIKKNTKKKTANENQNSTSLLHELVDEYSVWHKKNNPNDEIYNPEETKDEIRAKIQTLTVKIKKLEDKLHWREADYVRSKINQLNLKLYKLIKVSESKKTSNTLLKELQDSDDAEHLSKSEIEHKLDKLLNRQRQLRNAGDNEKAETLNFGIKLLAHRLRLTGMVSKNDTYASLYHPWQLHESKQLKNKETKNGKNTISKMNDNVKESKTPTLLRKLLEGDEPMSKSEIEAKIDELSIRKRYFQDKREHRQADYVNSEITHYIRKLRALGPVSDKDSYARLYHTSQIIKSEDEEELINSQPGMDRLKDKVASEEAHKQYTQLQATNNLSWDEKEELEAMAHSKTKAEPDPVKKIEWELHKLEAQKAHHQAHLNRANAKLQDLDIQDHVRSMIKHITIPEQETAIKKLTAKIYKYHTELDQLHA